MKVKVFDIELDLLNTNTIDENHPNICELSLVCVDNNNNIFTFHDIENKLSKDKIHGQYYLHYERKLFKIKNLIPKIIEKYPFDNVKKWCAIFFYNPIYFPIDTPFNEIFLNFNISEYLSTTKRYLSEQDIDLIIKLVSNKKKSKNLFSYEFYNIINHGYHNFIDKLNPKELINIGKFMVKYSNINFELFKKIQIKGPNQIIWIIKNQLYPLLNIGGFSKKTLDEAKDFIIKNIHKILPFINKNTFDIIEPLIEWNKFFEKNPDDFKYKISRKGSGFRTIVNNFNYHTEQDIMKAIFIKLCVYHPDVYDISDAQSLFCYYINNKDSIRELIQIKNKILFWKKVEYAISQSN